MGVKQYWMLEIIHITLDCNTNCVYAFTKYVYNTVKFLKDGVILKQSNKKGKNEILADADACGLDNFASQSFI